MPRCTPMEKLAPQQAQRMIPLSRYCRVPLTTWLRLYASPSFLRRCCTRDHVCWSTSAGTKSSTLTHSLSGLATCSFLPEFVDFSPLRLVRFQMRTPAYISFSRIPLIEAVDQVPEFGLPLRVPPAPAEGTPSRLSSPAIACLLSPSQYRSKIRLMTGACAGCGTNRPPSRFGRPSTSTSLVENRGSRA